MRKKQRGQVAVLQAQKRDLAFKKAMPKATEIRGKLRVARRGDCLIPQNDRDGPCSQELNNGHLIGRGHLRPIAKNGQVYEWDLTNINRIVSAWLTHGSTSMDDPYKIDIGRWEPADINIRRCTRRMACTNHDGPVFEGIDAAKLDVESPDHLFLIGFRAAAGTLALYESVLDLRHDLDYPEDVEFWKERGQWDQLSQNFDERWAGTSMKTSELSEWTQRWQDVYLDRVHRGGRVITAFETFTPRIRVACSSIYGTAEKPQFTLTIVPTQSGTEAHAIVSCLKTSGWRSRLGSDAGLRRKAKAICSQVVQMLEGDPGKWSATPSTENPPLPRKQERL